MKNKSFTLIELLVVIVIIGILAGVITMTTNTYIEQANLAKAQAFSSNASNRLWKNLISEWTFDLPAVEGVTEDTGGSNDGTVVGATHIPRSSDECVYGGCYSFDGVNDYIIGNNVPFGQEITVSVWAKPSTLSGTKTIVCENAPFILKVINNKFSSPSIIYAGGSWASVSGIKSLAINSWDYFIVTYVPGYIKTYINGELDTSVVKTGSLAGGGKLFIGGWSSGSALPDREFFKGLIDDFHVYDKALSLSQIKQQYVAGLDSLLSNGNISKEEYNERLNSLAFEGS